MNTLINTLLTPVKIFFAWIGRAMGDGQDPSSSRLIAVLSLLAIYLVPIFVWGYLSIMDHRMTEVPATVLQFIGTVAGPLLLFVGIQKRQENIENRSAKPTE